MNTFLYGALTGIPTSLILQPLEVIKTRMINENLSIGAATRKILGGNFSGFWRGIEPSMWRLVIGNGIYFSILELFGRTSMVGNAAAKVASTLVTIPITYIQVRQEAGTILSTPNIFKHLLLSIKTQGIKSIFNGSTPILFRDLPQSSIQFYIFNHILHYSSSKLGDVNGKLCAGFIAGGLSTIVTHPGETIRVITQARDIHFIQSIKKIYTENGVRGFFVGAGPRVVRRALFMGITWALYN